MAGNVKIQNANGKTVTLQNPDTNGSDITVDMSKLVVKDASGNVGIGVTPSAWAAGKSLEVGFNGNGIWSDQPNEIFFGTNSYWTAQGFKYATTGYASSHYKQLDGTHMWYSAPSGTAGNVITNTGLMALDTSGSLSVRNNISAGFDGSSFTTTPVGIASYHSASGNYAQIAGRNISDTTSAFMAAIGGVVKSAILANGSFLSATNSYGSTSDAKLKENVQDASPKLDKLMQVQVRTFNYIGQEEKQIGVVAQEIEQIFPSIVYATKDTKQVEVEKEREKTLEDGSIETEKYIETETVETGETTKNVKYSVIYMMMLKAMQEMNQKVEVLEAEVAALKAKEGGK